MRFLRAEKFETWVVGHTSQSVEKESRKEPVYINMAANRRVCFLFNKAVGGTGGLTLR